MTTSKDDQRLTELRVLAQQVRDYQIDRGWSNSRTASEITQIRSTKTYARILDPTDPLDELNLDNQIENFKGAADYIASRRANDRPSEIEYDDFENVTLGLAAISSAFVEESNRRFVAIKGENGTGKDAIIHALHKRPKWKEVTLSVEADTSWGSTAFVPFGTIIKEIERLRGREIKARTTFTYQRKELIVEHVGKDRLILVINEAHEMGWNVINEIKSLINRCPNLVVVALFVPALMRKLVTDNYEAARQLFGNRMQEIVTLPSPPPEEILAMCDRRGVNMPDATVRDYIKREVAKEAPYYGNWSFVCMFVREARHQSSKGPLTQDQASKSIQAVVEKRMLQGVAK